MISTVITFVITLGILVTFHEFGHYWVARRCGIKVHRFSIGFGQKLFGWTDRHGTEFVIAAIPLGGYVKMLDEREGDVPPELLSQAFTQKTPLQRIAVVAAGPLANFIFAIGVFWLMFLLGVKGLAPIMGNISVDSVAGKAGLQSGDEIIAVDDVPTATLQQLSMRLVNRIGETGEIRLSVLKGGQEPAQIVALPINEWLLESDTPDPINSLGLVPFIPEVQAVIGGVVENGRAEAGGLKAGDTILSANGVEVTSWDQWVELVKNAPEQNITLNVQSESGNERILNISPERKVLEDGTEIGFIGAKGKAPAWPESMIRVQKYGVVDAFIASVERTFDMIVLVFDTLKKIVIGLVSVKSLSGPITIAKVAHESVTVGLEAYLGLLAYLSISLGVLNLLPIPVLDGGHLMYYLIELVKGSPVSERIQMLGAQVGMGIIACIMLIALYNDVMRL